MTKVENVIIKKETLQRLATIALAYDFSVRNNTKEEEYESKKLRDEICSLPLTTEETKQAIFDAVTLSEIAKQRCKIS